MADSAVSTQSRPRRDASTKKRREATVSTETEKKLARAARSAQRLAQLSDVSRDDSTLDLFPDDPTRATLEAMNIDVRQGTLHGFELPDVVLAAVGALDTPSDSMSADAKAARRAPRAAKDDEPARVDLQLSGLEVELSTVTGSDAAHPMSAADLADQNEAVVSPREATPPLSPAMAAATVARSVTALRQAAERDVETVESAVGNRSEAGGKSSQRSASGRQIGVTVADQADFAEGFAASPQGGTGARHAASASARNANQPAEADRSTRETAATAPSAGTGAAFAAPWQEARPAEAAAAAAAVQRAAPELDRARATAFADTVDALYGVIADQRRAATDHSRRMKWMLSIVVGALLMTVAIGLTQTMLLMRLTRETTAQQHRIEQMLQSQQTAMASVLDTQIAMANAAAHAAPATVAPAPAPQQALMVPESANGQRAVHARHIRKPKTANSH
ncbi:hypothetical protein [Paraburkholderia caledonica]|uniref:hypothetical protein n=1 Tax=Paraburkholderia caledonica TaxID=134536 RepID=UPI000489819A|nr:hypothetical protein [Paraburkholderia caledonica]